MEIPKFLAEGVHSSLVERIDKQMDKVNHPAHYNKENRKECIEEMIDQYGLVETIIFCKLNAHKYLYRYDLKNGEEDIKKAAWYLDKMLELWQKLSE